jgi:hypothetical protein
MTDLAAKRAELAQRLRDWNAEPEGQPMTATRKTTRQVLEESEALTREMEQRDREERIEAEVRRRVQERLEQERAARKPPTYRRDLKPAEKSRLMASMGPDEYLALPWSPDRP